jgi:hypothetical protein
VVSFYRLNSSGTSGSPDYSPNGTSQEDTDCACASGCGHADE